MALQAGCCVNYRMCACGYRPFNEIFIVFVTTEWQAHGAFKGSKLGPVIMLMFIVESDDSIFVVGPCLLLVKSLGHVGQIFLLASP